MDNTFIFGIWKKITSAACDEIYPDQMEFLDNGVYLTPMRADVFKLWQSGAYEIMGTNRIKIEGATDAMLQYSFAVSEDGILKFVDNRGCTFRYERAKGAAPTE